MKPVSELAKLHEERQAVAALLGLLPGDHIPVGGTVLQDRARVMARRDWDMRVLDAWRAAAVAPRKRAYEFDERGHLYICEWQPFARMGQVRDKYNGSPGAARHAAALAVFPALPDDKRAELGECP